MKKLLTILALFTMLFYVSPAPASAALFDDWSGCTEKVVDGATGGTETEVATLRCLPVVFHNITSAFLIFVGAVSMFLIVYSGIKLILSGGDPKQVTAARQIMTYAIIGAVLVLSSFAILYFIGFITQSDDCITHPELIAEGGCR